MKHLLRSMVVLLLLSLSMTNFVIAQDDEMEAQTPDAICEAATPADDPASREYAESDDVMEIGVDYYAVFCTDAGAIYIDLLEDTAPLTVNNFIFLAENDYYNNTIFHRVIEDFMAQGGDPTGTGSGGPGYQFRDEFNPAWTFDRPGLLAMANAGEGTNGSQFFITTAETPHLNFRHTIFGEVLDGQDNVNDIMLRDPSAADSPSTALETVVILRDAEAVESDVDTTLETVDADTIASGLAAIGAEGQMPEDLIDGFVEPEVIATDDVPAVIADAGHEYRVTTSITNGQCSTQYFFESMTYTLDLLESAEAVESLLVSDEFATWHEENDFTVLEKVYNANVYQTEAESDCYDDATLLRAYVQRGPYLVAIDLVASNTVVEEASAENLFDLIAVRLPQIFENNLADVFRVPVQ